MKRIGPQMELAVSIVRANPGIVTYHVAKRLHRACANGKNNALGYNPIHRALKAGLIVKRDGLLYPVEST